jgi:hypothetical protein
MENLLMLPNWAIVVGLVSFALTLFFIFRAWILSDQKGPIKRGRKKPFKKVRENAMFCRVKAWENYLATKVLENAFKKISKEKAVIIMSKGHGRLAGPAHIPIDEDEEVIVLRSI